MKTGDSSFRGLFGGGQRIEIPRIQRDYAQGREDEHSQEVRTRFVKELADAFSVGRPATEPLDLDFIYGRWQAAERTLEPLDGQQRLTTLFLLHWYVASLDEAFDEFRSWIVVPDGGSCFTYRTRPAAREFFDALVQQPVPLAALGGKASAVSAWVVNSVWFVRSWQRDPTVRGCLTMIDAIHRRFAESKGIWPRLVSVKSPAITFRLLLLENFNLSDDLYVKMNARGKALTRFEVFKAELEQFVGRTYGSESCPHAAALNWRDYVSRQFDISWTDLLWKHRDETAEIDSRFMHLIRAVVVVRCGNHSDESRLPGQIEQLLSVSEPSLPVYEGLACVDRALVECLVGVLDTLAANDHAPRFLRGAEYFDETVTFRRILLARGANQDDGLTLLDWVMFFAWCTFLLRFPDDLGNELVRASFHDWIRVVANLARNSAIDRNERLVVALRGLRLLSKDSGAGFLSQVASGALEESGGFNQQQQREEQLKAKLILRNADWRPLIERAETHPYFRGDIEFLLRFSGVYDRAAKTDLCDWDDDEDIALRQSFSDWYDRTCAVFPESGTSWPTRFPDFLWERALLATGDYLLPRGPNWSFLDDKDRDASWKRLLRADIRVADRDARRDVVRRVLVQVDPKDVVGSLKTIIAAGVQGVDTAPVPGFRGRLVAEPRLIGYCGLRMVRFEEGSAYLLGRSQRNGYHVDLYVRDLYFRILSRLSEVAPFTEVQCNAMLGTFPPSQVILRAPTLGLSLSVEKHVSGMQLRLRAKTPSPGLVSGLGDWTAEGDTEFVRSVLPDAAEVAIIDLAGTIQGLCPAPAATPLLAHTANAAGVESS